MCEETRIVTQAQTASAHTITVALNVNKDKTTKKDELSSIRATFFSCIKLGRASTRTTGEKRLLYPTENEVRRKDTNVFFQFIILLDGV